MKDDTAAEAQQQQLALHSAFYNLRPVSEISVQATADFFLLFSRPYFGKGRAIGMSCCPSVCPSVTDVLRLTGRAQGKFFTRIISHGY